MKRLKQHYVLIALVLCAVLTWMGIVEKADNVTHRVLDLVNQLEWVESVQPFWMPFPIEAQAFRPLSVLGLKAYSSAFGVGPPSLWILGFKTFISLFVFCWASRSWLRAIGLRHHAELASLLPLGLAPVLFQAWYLPELDLFGAAGTLWIGAKLHQRSGLSRLEMGMIGTCLVAVLTLKESTALVQICFLGATTCLLFLQGFRGPRFRRHLKLTILSVAGWGALILPLLSQGTESTASKASLLSRIGIIEHNMVQVLYLGSSACAVLIVLGSIQNLLRKRPLFSIAGPLTGLVVLIASPPLLFYSHYEAVYFAPRLLGIGFAGALFIALFLFTLSSLREQALSMASGQIIFVIGALSFAALLAPNAREDMASRIFVALAPGLFALALSSADLIRDSLRDLPTSYWTKASHASLTCLLAGMIYYPAAHAWNYSADWQARHAVDLPGKQHVAEIKNGDLMLFNHYVEWLDPIGLISAGAPETVREWEFLHVPAWLPVSDYGRASWIYPGAFDMENALDHRQTHIYWLTPRSEADEDTRASKQSDLSWTRKNLGLFSPIVPGLHNRPEDHQMTIYQTGPSPLEEIMASGKELWSKKQDFRLLSSSLFEIPKQLLNGVSPLQSLHYEGRLVELPAPRRFPEIDH